ncbi:MAG: hypothetical protein ABIH41_00035, partial [Nanoarchaeota archaeon]
PMINMQPPSPPAPTYDRDARAFLVDRLDLLDRETPQYLFATKSAFNVIIRNRSGSDVSGELSRKPFISFAGFLTVFVPGYLQTMQYDGLALYDPGPLFAYEARNADGTWSGLGRLTQQDTALEEFKLHFDVHGTTHAINPLGNDEDAALADRITNSFQKYGTFEMKQDKKSRLVKPAYDASRYALRAVGLHESLEGRTLASRQE